MSQQTAGVAWPVIDGTRVPFEIYTSQDVFEREQERIFRGPLWNYVALEAEIPAPGDFKTSFVGDTPVVVSRAQDGGVHVFVNRCAHRVRPCNGMPRAIPRNIGAYITSGAMMVAAI